MKPTVWLLLAGLIAVADAQEWASRDLPNFPLKRESSHFCLFWNDTARLSLPAADSALTSLEAWWDFQIGQKRFPEPLPLRVPRMRTSVFLLEDGWAYGGMDGGLPALWFSPAAFQDPWAVGHEFSQSLQSATNGFQGSPFANWIWASHANWMTHQRLDTMTNCSELYTRQTHVRYGSTRNRFCNWQFLEYLRERHGYALLDSLWTRWPGSRPAAEQDFFGMLMETLEIGPAQLGDLWGDFALRMARADFQRGATYRAAWESRPEELARLQRIGLDAVDTAKGRWSVPFEVAPQAFGFNVVPLHDLTDSVRIEFRGRVQAARPAWNPGLRLDPDTVPVPASDWRWGIALVDTSASPAFGFRYLGPFPGSSGSTRFKASSAEKAYLVVAATPQRLPMVKWDQSYRSLYRYPWMVEISGARPEGWQHARLDSPAVAGRRHANGGGFVASTATVDSTAWVGPQAMVLETAQVLGKARIEDFAVVKGYATVRDQACVRQHARAWGMAVLRDRAVLAGHAVATRGIFSDSSLVDGFATVTSYGTRLSGAARLGGIAQTFGSPNLSGSVQVLGDAELWAVTASQGVFSGLVDASTVTDPLQGAGLTAAPEEVTEPFLPRWSDAIGIARQASRTALSLRRNGQFLSIAGIPAGTQRLDLLDPLGRILAWAKPGPDGTVRLATPARGLFTVLLRSPQGNASTRVAAP